MIYYNADSPDQIDRCGKDSWAREDLARYRRRRLGDRQYVGLTDMNVKNCSLSPS